MPQKTHAPQPICPPHFSKKKKQNHIIGYLHIYFCKKNSGLGALAEITLKMCESFC